MNTKPTEPIIEEIYPYPDYVSVTFKDGVLVHIYNTTDLTWMPANNTRFKPVPNQPLPKQLKVSVKQGDKELKLFIEMRNKEGKTLTYYEVLEVTDTNSYTFKADTSKLKLDTIYDVAILANTVINTEDLSQLP